MPTSVIEDIAEMLTKSGVSLERKRNRLHGRYTDSQRGGPWHNGYYQLDLSVRKRGKTIQLEDQIEWPLNIRMYEQLLEIGERYGYKVKGLIPTRVNGNGPEYVSTLEHHFENAMEQMYQANVWVSNHPAEVSARIQMRKNLEDRIGEITLRPEDNLDYPTIRVPFDDYSIDKVAFTHSYGNSEEKIGVKLDDLAYKELGEPSTLLAKKGPNFSTILLVVPGRIEKHMEVYAGSYIYTD